MKYMHTLKKEKKSSIAEPAWGPARQRREAFGSCPLLEGTGLASTPEEAGRLQESQDASRGGGHTEGARGTAGPSWGPGGYFLQPGI